MMLAYRHFTHDTVTLVTPTAAQSDRYTEAQGWERVPALDVPTATERRAGSRWAGR